MKDTIAILLSTYNGEQYLEEQIDSILIQDYKNWILYIRDDGSNDGTVDIIKQYVVKHTNIQYVEDDLKRGAAAGFLHLLKKIESKYYMFCDQDDVWFSSKISSLYNLLKNSETNLQTPILVFSDSEVVDQNLNPIQNSFWGYNKIHPKFLFLNKNFINVFNSTAGCTMLFNNSVKELIDFKKKNIIMHDWYIMILALKYGKIQYLDYALMLYRQHGNNVIGAKKIGVSSYFNKLKKIKETVGLQIDTFKFVKQFTNINFLNFMILKIRFNLKRFK